MSTTRSGAAVRHIEVSVDPAEALFDARDATGHEVTMDLAGKLGRSGGRGFAARDLLLAALAGCSGASFLAELACRGKTPQHVSISVRGELDSRPPAVFRTIAVHIVASGSDLDDESMTTAIGACRGDCSVHATLSHVAQITTTYEIAAPAGAGRPA
jgi:uncharacterized OsmC-like protein